MTVLSWENANGLGFTVGEGRLILLSAEGLEAPALRLAIAKGAGMNGAISASLRLEPRRIAVEALIDARGLDEAGIAAERTALCRAMSATDDYGTLTVKRAGRTRCIEAVAAGAPVFAKKRWNEPWQRVQLDFICPRPFFRSIEPVMSSVRYYASLTEFGLEGIEIPLEGYEFARIDHTGERTATIVNDGNEEAPVRIRFTGPMVNPYIKNRTTDAVIRITQMIRAGEYIEIDTEPGRRQIRLFQNGAERNGMHYLDLASSFWQLAPGENRVELGDESAGEGSEAFFEFYSHYLEA